MNRQGHALLGAGRRRSRQRLAYSSADLSSQCPGTLSNPGLLLRLESLDLPNRLCPAEAPRLQQRRYIQRQLLPRRLPRCCRCRSACADAWPCSRRGGRLRQGRWAGRHRGGGGTGRPAACIAHLRGTRWGAAACSGPQLRRPVHGGCDLSLRPVHRGLHHRGLCGRRCRRGCLLVSQPNHAVRHRLSDAGGTLASWVPAHTAEEVDGRSQAVLSHKLMLPQAATAPPVAAGQNACSLLAWERAGPTAVAGRWPAGRRCCRPTHGRCYLPLLPRRCSAPAVSHCWPAACAAGLAGCRGGKGGDASRIQSDATPNHPFTTIFINFKKQRTCQTGGWPPPAAGQTAAARRCAAPRGRPAAAGGLAGPAAEPAPSCRPAQLGLEAVSTVLKWWCVLPASQARMRCSKRTTCHRDPTQAAGAWLPAAP